MRLFSKLFGKKKKSHPAKEQAAPVACEAKDDCKAEAVCDDVADTCEDDDPNP